MIEHGTFSNGMNADVRGSSSHRVLISNPTQADDFAELLDKHRIGYTRDIVTAPNTAGEDASLLTQSHFSIAAGSGWDFVSSLIP